MITVVYHIGMSTYFADFYIVTFEGLDENFTILQKTEHNIRNSQE